MSWLKIQMLNQRMINSHKIDAIKMDLDLYLNLNNVEVRLLKLITESMGGNYLKIHSL